jgi:hypothetical protein
VSSGVQRLVVRPLIACEPTQRRVRSLRGAKRTSFTRGRLIALSCAICSASKRGLLSSPS